MKRTVINHLSSYDNNSNNNQNNKSDNDIWESLFNSTRVFSYDSSGKFCAFAKFNHTIEIWNMDCVLLPMIAFDCTKYLEQKEMICKSVVWSQDFTHIAVVFCRIDDARFKYSYPSRVLLWNILSQQFTSTLIIPVIIQSIIFVPQSNTQLCITGVNQQILVNPTSSATTINAEINTQQTAITETVLYRVDTIAKHMRTIPLDTQSSQDSSNASMVLLETLDEGGDNSNITSNNHSSSSSSGSSSSIDTKVLISSQKSSIDHSIPSSSSSSSINYHNSCNINSSIILLSTSRFATVPSSSSSSLSSPSSSASLFYAVVTTSIGIEIIQLVYNTNKNDVLYTGSNSNYSQPTIDSISGLSNSNNQIKIRSRYKINIPKSITSVNITSQTTTDITATNNNSNKGNNNTAIISTTSNNKLTEVTHTVLSSNGQNLLLSLSTGQLIIVDLVQLNNNNNNNNHTCTNNDIFDTTTDNSINNSSSINNIDSGVKLQDQFISSIYEFTQHTENTSSQSSSSSSSSILSPTVATPLTSRHHLFYGISFIDNLPPVWCDNSISNDSIKNNDNNDDNYTNDYNSNINIIEEEQQYYYIVIATKYQPQPLLSSSSSSSFLLSTAGKLLYLKLRKQVPAHSKSFSPTIMVDCMIENVKTDSINNSNSNGNNEEIDTSISQPPSSSSLASTSIQQQLYNRMYTEINHSTSTSTTAIKISQSNILRTIPLPRASLIQSVTFRPNPIVNDNNSNISHYSNTKNDNSRNSKKDSNYDKSFRDQNFDNSSSNHKHNNNNEKRSIRSQQHQQITAATTNTTRRLRDQILILSPFYCNKCTAYIHEPFYSTFDSTFPGPMYPAGFRLLQQIVPYIEKEDELDVVVVAAASTVKEKAVKVGYNSNNNIANGLSNAPSSSTSSSSSSEIFIDVGTTSNSNNNSYLRNDITIDHNNIYISDHNIHTSDSTDTSYLLDDDGNLCRLPFDYNHSITTSNSSRNNNNNNASNTTTNVSANSTAGIKKPFPTKTSSSSSATTSIGKKRSSSVLNNNSCKSNSSYQNKTATSATASVINNNQQQFTFNPFSTFFHTPRNINNNSFHRLIDINAETAAVAHASLKDEKYMAEKHKQIQLEAVQSIQKIYHKRMREKQLRELKALEHRQQNKLKLEIGAQIQENNCMLREENLTRYYNVIQAMEIEFKLLKSTLIERANSSTNSSNNSNDCPSRENQRNEDTQTNNGSSNSGGKGDTNDISDDTNNDSFNHFNGFNRSNIKTVIMNSAGGSIKSNSHDDKRSIESMNKNGIVNGSNINNCTNTNNGYDDTIYPLSNQANNS